MAAGVAASLPVRQAVRQHLMAGRVGEAEALLAHHAPALAGPAGDSCVFFYLTCLKFIELVRCAVLYTLDRKSSTTHPPWLVRPDNSSSSASPARRSSSSCGALPPTQGSESLLPVRLLQG